MALSSVLLVMVFCSFGSIYGSNKLFHWRRKLDDGRSVSEIAVQKAESRTVLMSSSDSCLKDSEYLPSLSLHDFNAVDSEKEEGLLALKVIHRGTTFCFVKSVARNYEDTINELHSREPSKAIPLAKPEKTKFKMGDFMKNEELQKRSQPLAKFCEDAIAYQVNPFTGDIPKSFRPIHTLCIWFPIPIYIPYWYFGIF